MVENFNEVERKKACPELDSGNDQNGSGISLGFLIALTDKEMILKDEKSIRKNCKMKNCIQTVHLKIEQKAFPS